MNAAQLSYLNGFLQAVAFLNVDAERECWYLIEPVDRGRTLAESLDAHFADFTRWVGVCPGGVSAIEAAQLPHWKPAVDLAVRQWFFGMQWSTIRPDECRAVCLAQSFLSRLEGALVGPAAAWAVRGASVDEASTDILIEDAEGYYLLRMSSCA